MEVQCTVNEGYESEEVESLAGSDIVDPEVLRDMLSRMDEGGDDARAAARCFFQCMPDNKCIDNSKLIICQCRWQTARSIKPVQNLSFE